MQKKVKCLISVFLSLCVIVSLTITVAAIEPRFSDTDSASVNLIFSGTTATCSVKIYGADGTTSIDKVNIYLKDSKGNIKAKWENLSSNGKNFSFSDTVSNLTKGETYTLAFSANVNRNGRAEPITGSSTQPCPSK